MAVSIFKKLKYSIFGIDNLADLSALTKYDEKKLLWEIGKRVIWTSSEDSRDFTALANKALSTRKGDCLNFASIVLCVMKEWGWPAHIVAAWPTRPIKEDEVCTGHAVCIFTKPDGTSWQSSNDELSPVKDVNNAYAIAKDMFENMYGYEVYSL